MLKLALAPKEPEAIRQEALIGLRLAMGGKLGKTADKLLAVAEKAPLGVARVALYSFAGAGIKFAPTDEDIAAIPLRERHNYLLQERIQFTPVIITPYGDTSIEVRIMYLWPKGGDLLPVLPLIRMGRGKMMGVDHNRSLEWVGSSAALIATDS